MDASVKSGLPPLTTGVADEIGANFAASEIVAAKLSVGADEVVIVASIELALTVITGTPFVTVE